MTEKTTALYIEQQITVYSDKIHLKQLKKTTSSSRKAAATMTFMIQKSKPVTTDNKYLNKYARLLLRWKWYISHIMPDIPATGRVQHAA